MEPVFNFVEMFERSIGLKDPWKVVRAEFKEQQREVHVYVEARKTVKYACPVCGKLSVRYDEEEDEREWRHADVVMYPCYVHCRRPRVECPEHGIHVVEAPWARKGARQTLLFEGYAMMLAETMTLNEARRVLRISRTALMHIVGHQAHRWVGRQQGERRQGENQKAETEPAAAKPRTHHVENSLFLRAERNETITRTWLRPGAQYSS